MYPTPGYPYAAPPSAGLGAPPPPGPAFDFSVAPPDVTGPTSFVPPMGTYTSAPYAAYPPPAMPPPPMGTFTNRPPAPPPMGTFMGPPPSAYGWRP